MIKTFGAPSGGLTSAGKSFTESAGVRPALPLKEGCGIGSEVRLISAPQQATGKAMNNAKTSPMRRIMADAPSVGCCELPSTVETLKIYNLVALVIKQFRALARDE
jgi:hypothetical protein